jgi:hypothetical protein
MVTAVGAFSEIPIPLPAVEAFPTNLSVIHLAGLDGNLDDQTTARLHELEKQLRASVDVAPILRMRTQRTFEEAFKREYRKAVSYYIESGILVWRALDYDYSRLLGLSQTSCATIDSLFFTHARKLERETFISSVTSLRALAKVGEWVILSEESDEISMPPLDYLDKAVLATFLTWCILAYLTEEVRNARRDNLKALSDSLLAIGDSAYQEAIKAGIHIRAKESHHWYWSPSWQEGEVEADLDKHVGDLETFASVEELVQDLRE